MSIENKTSDTAAPTAAPAPAPADQSERQYEKSGLYPEDSKPFRIYALLGWLLGIVVFIAASSAVLDRILL